MRSFNFKAKLIGEEKYLTYIMGEETELDEDVLDYCEENNLEELVRIIYEEDDDYDYLTYDVTGQHTVEELLAKEMKCEGVLLVLRNIANGLISLKEQAIKLNYILLNRQFMYVDDDLNVKFICLPVESSGGLAAEFKGFVRQFLANIRYDVDEDLNYVGKLLTYINGDSFNLRGLVGLTEALMDEEGISFEEVGGIEADGVEVMNSEDVEADSVKSFMDSFADAADDEVLPEIGDDDDEAEEEEESAEAADEELDSILPAGMKVTAAEEEAETSVPEEEATEEKSESEQDAAKEEEQGAEEAAQPVEEEVTEATEEEAAEEEAKKAEEAAEAVSEDESEEDTAAEERGNTDNLKAEEAAEAEPEKETEDKAEAEATQRPKVKETDPEVLKSRIMAIAGSEAEKKKTGKEETFKSEQEMDTYFGSKPPVIKKNSVKVNRAAIIQNIAASEEEAEQAAAKEAAAKEAAAKEAAAKEAAAKEAAEKEEQPVPVIEEVAENTEEKKASEKKPKSNSILSKSVEAPKQSTNVVNIAKAMPYLVRVNTDEKIMIRKDVFKIGKASLGVDYTVSGNGAISRLHAIIVRKDDVSYIKDNKSTNHTYVNDKMVEDGEEIILTHDSLIRLGDEEFLFKIR